MISTAESVTPGATNDLLLGGQPADLDHIAALMLQMQHSTPSAEMPAPPVSPLGSAMPSRPVAPSSGTNAFESSTLPGSEMTHLGTSALLNGQDPSLVSVDLLPLRGIGRDMPLAPPRVAAPASTSHAAPARSGSGGPPPFEGAQSLPFTVPAAGPGPALPMTASDAAPDYYFLSPHTGGTGARTHVPGSQRGPMIRNDFPILRQRVNGHRLVWLDSAATTQKPEVVIETEAEFYRRDNSNVHRGAHTLAKRATDAYEAARRKVQGFLGAASMEEIVFVRGATEGINLIAQTLGRQIVGEGDEVLVSHLEHHSNIVPWQMLCREKKAVLRVVPVDDRGDIQLDAYESLLGPRTRIVALTHVSNVTGTLVPIAPMAAMAHRHGAFVVVDGAQSVAHVPVDVTCLDADFFVFSGHKLYAPTGIGAVYGKKALLESMPPWQGGGSMIESVSFEQTVYAAPPAKFEAGTGHFAGAVGLGAAIDYLEALGREDVAAHEQALMHYAIDAMMTVPGLRLLGSPTVRIGALAFVMEGHEHDEVAQALDRRGIAVRAGHHCAQPILRRIAGLTASVRASLGVYNAHDDIDAMVSVLRELAASRKR